MNRRLMAASALLFVALGTPVAAFAQISQHALTRAQVIADLAQAERDGTVPDPNSDYPPSAQAAARHREMYAIAPDVRTVVNAPTSVSNARPQ
ncbi:hypothetical protein J2785_000034 [Burkholderia ambifaria]|nr:DUF4148 domain-containing protein [Burkholderia ambifaria]MDR6496892.1 hypothetical protein [Burkholderia ambifaria]